MELIHIFSTMLGGLLLVIAYFLKSVFSDVKKLKDKDVELALMDLRMKSAEKRIESHHGKIGDQALKSTEFDILFTRIDGRLDSILEKLGE